MRIFSFFAAGVSRRAFSGTCVFLTAVGFVSPACVHAFTVEGPRWPSNKSIVMYVELNGASGTLSDGSTSWDEVAESALSVWNPCLGSGVQFSVGTTTIPNINGDKKNSVYFGTSASGSAFGDDTLAVTVYTTNSAGTQFTEADVVVNSSYTFDSYRGPLRAGGDYDLRRVLLHEFGHVLGLDHPANTSVAVMAPVISDIDTIQADDIAGVESIYGAIGGVRPVITSSLNASLAVGQPFQYQVVASDAPISYYAANLPTGLVFNTTTGIIYGTSTSAPGSYNVTLTATNAAGPTTATLVLTIHGPPVVTSAGVVTAQAGSQFTYQITATGSPTSYLATNYYGSPLPSTFTFNATTGLLKGTMPDESGAIFVGATNAYGSGKALLQLDATLAPPVITDVGGSAVGHAYVGTNSQFQIDATHDADSYSATGLPTGMAVDSQYGYIVGFPATPGTYTVAVSATNSAGTGRYTWTLQVGRTITLTSGELTGRVGQPLSYQITGNPTPTSFQFSTDYMLSGIALDPTTGIISGTPTSLMTGTLGLILSNGTDYASTYVQIEISPAFVSSFFNGEVDYSGVYYLTFPNGGNFGSYAYLADPHYIYHFDMGYEYVFDANDGASGAYFYDFSSSGFFYSSPTFAFPYLYDFSLNSVVYYYPDPVNPGRYNTNGKRYFYVFSTGQIISK